MLTIRDVPNYYELVTSSWQVNHLNVRFCTNFNAFFVDWDNNGATGSTLSVYGIKGICLACNKEIYHVMGDKIK